MIVGAKQQMYKSQLMQQDIRKGFEKKIVKKQYFKELMKPRFSYLNIILGIVLARSIWFVIVHTSINISWS